MRIVLADDETIALERLAGLFRAMPEVEIVGRAQDGIEAARLIAEKKPDIAFLDIGMPHRSGMDVARQLKAAASGGTEIVFVTAFSEFAAEAFELDAVDYLLKPVLPERLRAAILRARRRAHATARSPQQSGPSADQNYISELWVRQGGGTVRIDTETIEWIEAAGDYVLIHTGERSHIQRVTMEALQRQLDPKVILRVSRSAFVRRSAVARVERASRSAINIILGDETVISVGHTYVQAVGRAFGLKGALETPD